MRLQLPESKRAPERGRYDRACSSGQRFQMQRARLLQATAAAYLNGVGNVARVVALSGVGRNTFYECFDDFPHALDAVRANEVRRVGRALASLPFHTMQSEIALFELCRLWLVSIGAEPVTSLVALEAEPGRVTSRLLMTFQTALATCVAPLRARDEPALLHAAACAEASARAMALRLLSDSLREGDGWPSSRGGALPRETVAALERAVGALVG